MVKFSVVMPVYAKDRAEWFEQAIESVLGQTVPSDDIIIVADGPLTEELENTLGKYAAHDTISVVRIEKNQGLSNALNLGINNAKHDLIARMDSDDIAVKERFELQVAAFSKNKKLGILGGQIAEFIDNPEEIVSYRKVPVGHDEIKTFARRRSPFNHPTVMYKKSVIQGLDGYDVTAVRIEDYDLWLRALNNGVVCENIDAVLLKYRSTRDAIKRRKTFKSLKSHINARAKFLSRGYISFSDFCYGAVTQTALFVLPNSVADAAFKKVVRVEE